VMLRTNYSGAYSSYECLGIHLGGPQSADLGDGHGAVNQTVRNKSHLRPVEI